MRLRCIFAWSLVLLVACGGPLDGSVEVAQTSADIQIDAKVCPGADKVYGIDVSDYDGTIDWNAVYAAGKQFAIIRASDGTGYLDKKFSANWHGAKAAGLVVGAYQYFRPKQDPIAQADLMLHFLTSVSFVAGDLPPVIDVEGNDGLDNATVLARINAWLLHIKTSTGRLPVLYSSARVWNILGNPTPSPLPYLWNAQWNVGCPNLPPNWGRLRFWQYTDSGSVPGIEGPVDLDLYNGTLRELRAL